MGVAIGQRACINEHLARDLRIQPFEPEPERDLGYYLCYPPEGRQTPRTFGELA